MRQLRGSQHRHDLSGADDRAESGHARRRSDCRGGSRSLIRSRKSEAWQRAVEGMKDVAIPDAERRARDYPHQLSGGMRQRVMIAMAIVNRPQAADRRRAHHRARCHDPGADSRVAGRACGQKFGLAMLFISHDLAVVSQVADRVAVMYAGNLVELGPKRDIFQAPAHPYTRGLAESRTHLEDRPQPSACRPSKAPCLRCTRSRRDVRLSLVASFGWTSAPAVCRRWRSVCRALGEMSGGERVKCRARASSLLPQRLSGQLRTSAKTLAPTFQAQTHPTGL